MKCQVLSVNLYNLRKQPESIFDSPYRFLNFSGEAQLIMEGCRSPPKIGLSLGIFWGGKKEYRRIIFSFFDPHGNFFRSDENYCFTIYFKIRRLYGIHSCLNFMAIRHRNCIQCSRLSRL